MTFHCLFLCQREQAEQVAQVRFERDGKTLTVFYYNDNGKDKVEKAMENGDQK